ncbi:MAG: nuclear transport factor 2 family protein [Acidobacteriia bacterium]|nr:nuclear transport factor 2 family protein [Terriglobia bacterium]
MKRRGVLMGIAGSCATDLSAQSSRSSSANDVHAAIRNYYAVWQSRDVSRYRDLLTDDYMLLENGERMTVEDDVKMMPRSGSQRSDVFDFHATEIVGEIAYAHWFLKSKIVDEKGSGERRWLESSVLRRSQGIWKVALLHSTRIEKK